MDDLDDDVIPQKLMTGPIWTALVAFGLSFAISVRTTETVNGQIVHFRDWGAVGLGGLALVLALLAASTSFGPLAGDKKIPRLGIIAVIALGACYRLAYGFGVFA